MKDSTFMKNNSLANQYSRNAEVMPFLLDKAVLLAK